MGVQNNRLIKFLRKRSPVLAEFSISSLESHLRKKMQEELGELLTTAINEKV